MTSSKVEVQNQTEGNMINVEGRHQAVQEFGDMFAFSHLPEGLPREVSSLFCGLAAELLNELPDGPGLTRALHRLWESKNEAVFLAVRTQRQQAKQDGASS